MVFLAVLLSHRMSLNDTCRPFRLNDTTEVCNEYMVDFRYVKIYLFCFVNLAHIIAFSRLIYVLVTPDGCRSIEYIVRVQVLNHAIASNFWFVVRIVQMNMVNTIMVEYQMSL
ncbi:hypothetical protein PRIPAC_88609 [Pristionchus pacificus]|uniref:Uncharacterized protein n=1 Tax=Pristionchus pacificus TaxID=54126 RepID=A0A2A6B6X1_PRIPA|nr:hypothetical protein PRIPAC_88609 [Pristionchus pacificus]|eukprot:PDM61614.1 hypothetical protein PRIPAC_51056 [Pristionchus pacificus]